MFFQILGEAICSSKTSSFQALRREMKTFARSTEHACLNFCCLILCLKFTVKLQSNCCYDVIASCVTRDAHCRLLRKYRALMKRDLIGQYTVGE